MLFQHVFFVLLMVALKELCFGFQRLPKKQTMLLIHLRSSASTNDDTMVPLNKASITRVCRNCKQQYNNNDIPNANSQESGCQFHPGIYSGRLNRINDVDTSDLEYFWSCCGNYDLTSKGCILSSKHVSYDDISYTRYSVLTGKEITYWCINGCHSELCVLAAALNGMCSYSSCLLRSASLMSQFSLQAVMNIPQHLYFQQLAKHNRIGHCSVLENQRINYFYLATDSSQSLS